MGFVTLSGSNCKSICSNNILDDVLRSESHRSFARRIWQKWVRMCCNVVKKPQIIIIFMFQPSFYFWHHWNWVCSQVSRQTVLYFIRQIILWSYFPLNLSFKGIPLVKKLFYLRTMLSWKIYYFKEAIILVMHKTCKHTTLFLKLSNVKFGCKAVAFG